MGKYNVYYNKISVLEGTDGSTVKHRKFESVYISKGVSSLPRAESICSSWNMSNPPTRYRSKAYIKFVPDGSDSVDLNRSDLRELNVPVGTSSHLGTSSSFLIPSKESLVDLLNELDDEFKDSGKLLTSSDIADAVINFLRSCIIVEK